MNYDPDRQFRCTIIRGKSITRMDDYLPVYAQILESICPIHESKFAEEFDRNLTRYITDDLKTVRNHRTENAGKLLGMYICRDGQVYPTQRTLKFLEDRDQPAFFKSVCYRFQQPNGSQKIGTIIDKVKNGIKLRPYHFVLALLRLAEEYRIVLSRDQIGYYALNCLDVLQGNARVEAVMSKIMQDVERGFKPRVQVPGKAYSYSMQHINEQMDYLVLANLIRSRKDGIVLNTRENAAIELFMNALGAPLEFDLGRYDLRRPREGRLIEAAWQEYFGSMSKTEADTFVTDIDSLASDELPGMTYQIYSGREGESFVFDYEKKTVRRFNRHYTARVSLQGKSSGLGYDIVSLEAGRDPSNPSAPRYISVKTSKRVHAPNLSESIDTAFLSRNEWAAAERYGQRYYIYKVYFTVEGICLNVIQDPAGKNRTGALRATPVSYRLEFNNCALSDELRFGKAE